MRPALHDDATCAVLQFVDGGDVARGVAPTCRRLRDLGQSDALLTLRRASDYHLRGDHGGVATRLGMRPWPVARVRIEAAMPGLDEAWQHSGQAESLSHPATALAPRPPPQLCVDMHRVSCPKTEDFTITMKIATAVKMSRCFIAISDGL